MTQNEETYVEWGPELPASYGEDLAVALVRDPECIVFYWDVAPAHVQATHVARVHCLSKGTHYDIELPPVRNVWHLAVESNQTYRIDLLARAPDGSLLTLAESAEISLPVRHAWQAGHKPAEVLHAERHPLTRPAEPPEAPAPAWPETSPVPPPAEVTAPPAASAPARWGSIVTFGKDR